MRRQLALGQIRQYPDPVLRLRSGEVEAVDESLRSLVERMTRIMRDAQGVGLAAPQIGILRRVVVYQAGEDAPVVALVNPRIVSRSDELKQESEGCLSLGVATVNVSVERPSAVDVEAVGLDGEPLAVAAEGLEARVIQHEVDHLDGVLIIDRTGPEERKQALGRLRGQPILV